MISWWEASLRLLGAMALGAVVGWEREASGKPAGLRTHTLVALGSALFVVSAMATAMIHDEPVDALRAMAGVAQGIGFLGAGLIVQTHGEVRWLTTAASLWTAAALGLSIGVGQYAIAAVGTLLVVVTLHWLDRLEALVTRPKTKRAKVSKPPAGKGSRDVSP